MAVPFTIDGRRLGPGCATYIIAEMSANHHQDFDHAVQIVRAAHAAGADAVKLQTYTADTLTLRCTNSAFHISGGTPWDGRTLHDLYRAAYMPWDWQPRLKVVADEIGIELFSTPFDPSAVAFLEQMGAPAYKVASFELVDLPLIGTIARTGKPMIISTGMATLAEITEAVEAARRAGAQEIALLKCTSAYPAPPDEMNLRTIPHLAEAFGVPAGLSDHTLGIAVPVASVALGACIIEKHFTLSRSVPGPDSAFSLEPNEFQEMVQAVRAAEQALGQVSYGLSDREHSSRNFRRSLFITQAMKVGEEFTVENVRSIRPAAGLPPRHLPEILGRRASADIAPGTPLSWRLVA